MWVLGRQFRLHKNISGRNGWIEEGRIDHTCSLMWWISIPLGTASFLTVVFSLPFFFINAFPLWMLVHKAEMEMLGGCGRGGSICPVSSTISKQASIHQLSLKLCGMCFENNFIKWFPRLLFHGVLVASTRCVCGGWFFNWVHCFYSWVFRKLQSSNIGQA